MTNNTKTFRLFISSTFSDFKIERETLQTRIFPEIKEYCFNKGYTFQPIDLRWGVSNEAQLDQKALDMCIKEVQSCKRHDYPNFLIMLGDRYGWIPLPNIIESSKFETIIKNIETSEEKNLLLNWYYEDKNQIPSSYILKERTEEYVEYGKWVKVESKLKDILQNAVKNIDDDDIESKYFTSATESEAIEGIISYFSKTDYQQKLLQLIPELEQLDHKHIFGFFRDIDKNSTIEDKFISEDYDRSQIFKDKVKNQLINENTLNVTTSQVSKEKLDENYLDEFIESVTQFLKSQVDIQIKQDEEKNYTSLEIEKQQQYSYLNQKLENFLGQEKVLNKIQNYINNDDNKPLVICGESGIGKSSIMAQAIENATNPPNKKIIYRFVGATPNSTTTKGLLASILEELNITVENKQANEIENQFLTDIDKEENSFVKFSHQVYDEIQNLEDDIVIFIDAVDQLSNDDQFLWLPNNLPLNIKIVISALKDQNYTKDSKYFYTLENKISSYIEIESFNKPIELLESLLSQQNRTLQEEQKEYFLEQYSQVNTPLYIYMAANKMLYWKSSDIADNDATLSKTQKDIVKELIANLTKLHHHDKSLVQKVFGYILASKDGLSEYEILELLNTDKEFIKTIAPDTWHINTTQELPLVIWTRLHNYIKQFLSIKKQDGQELLYFFHREFIDVIQTQNNQKKEHENIIEATQKLIEKHQDQEFQSNRWGKLYCILITQYYIKYSELEKIKFYCEFISYLSNDLSKKYILYIYYIASNFEANNKSQESLSCKEIEYFITDYLYNKNKEQWSIELAFSIYLVSLQYYILTNIDKAKELMSMNMKINFLNRQNEEINQINLLRYELLSYLYKDNKSINYLQKAISIENDNELLKCSLYHRLAVLYFELGDFEDYNLSYKNGMDILIKYGNEKEIRIQNIYNSELIKYALLKSYSDIDSAINMIETPIFKLSEIYNSNKKRYTSNFIEINIIVIAIYTIANLYEDALKTNQKLIDIILDLYKDNNYKWINKYIILLQNKASILLKLNSYSEYKSTLIEALETLRPFYKKDNIYWNDTYSQINMEIKLFLFTTFGKASNKNNRDENIDYIKDLYNDDNLKYLDHYSELLYENANNLISNGSMNDALKLLYTNIDITKKGLKNNNKYIDRYIMALVILSKAHVSRISQWSDNKNKIMILLEEIYETIQKNIDLDRTENLILCSDILSSLMNLNRVYENIEKAIYYNNIDLEITEKLYATNKEKFFDAYSHSLMHLGFIYKKKKDLNTYESLLKQSVIISADYYEHRLTLFANKYLQIKKANDIIAILNELQVAKELYYRDKDRWAIHYLNYLSLYIYKINSKCHIGYAISEENNYVNTKKWIGECKEVLDYINYNYKNKFPNEENILKSQLVIRNKIKNKYFIKLLLMIIISVPILYFAVTYIIILIKYVLPILLYMFGGILSVAFIITIYKKIFKN